MTDSYNHIAPYYDRLHGDRRMTIRYIKYLLNQYHPQAHSILSVGCGTGQVTKALAKHYHIVGTDASEPMLDIAQKRLPKNSFYHQDLQNLAIDETFDAVICLFGVLNHVLNFQEWEQFFQTVKLHMQPNGVFIFDILTQTCLYNLLLNSPTQMNAGFLQADINITHAEDKDDDTVFNWQVKGRKLRFLRRAKQLFDSHVQHTSFDVDQIQQALQQRFTHVQAIDPENNQVNENSELVFFIAHD